jgi:ArsR family transcriptional regulator, arsenate/arsenite/antimonite-responsive transcriptional repressor
MRPGVPSDEHLESSSRIHHALSDSVRMKILCLLQVQQLCVCVIEQCVRMADSKISYHRNILKETGLIEGQTKKNWIIYHLTAKGEKISRDERGDFSKNPLSLLH